MKKLMPVLLLAGMTSTAYAQIPSPDEIMELTDANKDGVITKEEAAGTPLVNFFDMIDANHDGKITLDELKAMAAGPRPSGLPPGSAPPPAK